MPSPAPIAPLLATLPEFPGIGESLAYQLNGLLVVLSALGLLWGLLEFMGAAFRRAPTRPAPPAAAATTAPGATAAVASVEVLAPADRAAIVAAVHFVLSGRRHRVVAIRSTAPDADWSREGRRSLFASHKIR